MLRPQQGCWYYTLKVPTKRNRKPSVLMISERFEDDMAEISGDGYLMLCKGRNRVFMKDCAASPVDLSIVSCLRAQEGEILVEGSTGQVDHCPFPKSSKVDLEPVVERLNQLILRWRA